MTGEPSTNVRGHRSSGVLCAFAATALGIAYLAMAGAPPRYLLINAAAFLLGLVAFRGIGDAGLRPGRFTGWSTVLCALGLLATAVLGSPVEGAARWLWLGPLSVQPSLILVPLMIVLFARRSDLPGAIGIAGAAAALALQPDRSMAAVLAVGIGVLAMTRPGRLTVAALLAAIGGFVVTLMRPDSLPAVPYVDQILFIAFDVHILAGLAVVLGSLLLLVPAVAGWRRDRARRPVYLVFGATWLACVLSAALGNYPTPVVGYGGSAILGYLLSLSFLPARTAIAANLAPGEARQQVDPDSATLRTALLT